MSILIVNYCQLFSICGLEECACTLAIHKCEVGLSGEAAGIKKRQLKSILFVN